MDRRMARQFLSPHLAWFTNPVCRQSCKTIANMTWHCMTCKSNINWEMANWFWQRNSILHVIVCCCWNMHAVIEHVKHDTAPNISYDLKETFCHLFLHIFVIYTWTLLPPLRWQYWHAELFCVHGGMQWQTCHCSKSIKGDTNLESIWNSVFKKNACLWERISFQQWMFSIQHEGTTTTIRKHWCSWCQVRV